MNATELGGFKELILGIEGEDAYRELQYESGGHRVQRVPETETKGRIHTSAATVAVLAEPEDVEIDIKPDDYRKDTVLRQRSRRAARQQDGLRRPADALRNGHRRPLPGRKEPAQEFCQGPARAENPALRASAHRSSTTSGPANARRWSARAIAAQRIRTYNFPDNRVTDHRINLTLYKLDAILAGNVQPVTDALLDYDRQQQRQAMGTLD